MLQVFAPQVVLYGIGIVLTGILQAHRRFGAPAVAPLLSSLVVIGAYVAFAVVAGTGADVAATTPGERLILSRRYNTRGRRTLAEPESCRR